LCVKDIDDVIQLYDSNHIASRTTLLAIKGTNLILYLCHTSMDFNVVYC